MLISIDTYCACENECPQTHVFLPVTLISIDKVRCFIKVEVGCGHISLAHYRPASVYEQQ